MGKNLPVAGLFRPFGVDRHDDALRAESLCGLADELRLLHRRRIDADFVGPGVKQEANVRQRAHAASDRQGHEDLGRSLHHHINDGFTVFVRSGDIQKTQLVRAFTVVDAGHFHRIARIAQIDKTHSLNDSAVLDVQAGNDALG
jgi:hypothetical protein